MEYMRWILLAAGVLFVIVVYFISKNRRTQRYSDNFESSGDVSDFSAVDLDSVDEGVGEVRVIASMDGRYEDQYVADHPDPAESDAAAHEESERIEEPPQISSTSEQPAQTDVDEVITLYIMTPNSDDRFIGGQINSAARACGLSFGEMNIFHKLDDEDHIRFSMANMMKPGSFDPETMYDVETSGLALFMQPALVDDASETLDDMLHTSYQLSEMLGGQLCNHRREVISAEDADRYRASVASH